MVSLSCCYVKLIVGHPTLPRCRAVIVSEQLCRGFWRNTSCLVHLAQERGVYSACVCVCVHIAPPLFFDFPVQAVSLLQSLSQMKEKHSLIYIGMRKLFISAPLPSFQSLSFLLLAFSVWIKQDLPLSWEGWRPRDIKLWRPVLWSHNSINSLTDNWLLIKFC